MALPIFNPRIYFTDWIDKKDAKEELLRRIKELAPVEKALYGIEEASEEHCTEEKGNIV